MRQAWYIISIRTVTVTYDHRLRRIGHPVRSAIHKPQIGRLVVGWVTTSEYLLLYVFGFCLPLFPFLCAVGSLWTMSLLLLGLLYLHSVQSPAIQIGIYILKALFLGHDALVI
jgi:hypothetical protein